LLIKSLPWSYEFITKYEQFWNFYALPLNKGIPWTQELVLHPKIVDKNLSTVKGENLWTEEFLIQNAEILHWEFLCANQHIKWSEELIDKLSPYWKKAEKKAVSIPFQYGKGGLIGCFSWNVKIQSYFILNCHDHIFEAFALNLSRTLMEK
jgi:hypothetical protein